MFIALFFAGAAQALEVSPESVTGSPGDSIVVPITISDVGGGVDADAFSFIIRFDADVLTFTEADRSGTLTESFSLVEGQEIETGQVKVNGSLFGTPIHIFLDNRAYPAQIGELSRRLSDASHVSISAVRMLLL